jgi:hypothetical protein
MQQIQSFEDLSVLKTQIITDLCWELSRDSDEPDLNEVQITLKESEAEWLHGVMQNSLPNESAYDIDVRTAIWDATK